MCKFWRDNWVWTASLLLTPAVPRLLIQSPHYGTEFRIEVVDASTDKSVGMFLLTAQALLQEQRDLVVQHSGVSLLSFLYAPGKHEGKRRLICELRTGFKAGFGSEFFSASKTQAAKDSAPRPGMYIVRCFLIAWRHQSSNTKWTPSDRRYRRLDRDFGLSGGRH